MPHLGSVTCVVPRPLPPGFGVLPTVPTAAPDSPRRRRHRRRSHATRVAPDKDRLRATMLVSNEEAPRDGDGLARRRPRTRVSNEDPILRSPWSRSTRKGDLGLAARRRSCARATHITIQQKGRMERRRIRSRAPGCRSLHLGRRPRCRTWYPRSWWRIALPWITIPWRNG